MRSLLKQLLRIFNHLPIEVESVYEKRHQPGEILSLDVASRNFSTVSEEIRNVYICLDALDECTDSTRHELLSVLKTLPSTVRLFMTSRRGVKAAVQRYFERMAFLEIKADEDDIRQFLTQRIAQDKRDTPDLMDTEFEEEIISKISKSAGGL